MHVMIHLESAIPVLSMFLTKLLTEDLPRLFVHPKKIVLDFQKGKAPGPVSYDSEVKAAVQEGSKYYVGELSVTLVNAKKLAYVKFGKTDPYVILSLGDQVIRSKKNSQTSVIGSPGEPIWNQDFHLLVTNPRKQKLYIQVKDSFGVATFTVGSGEVELESLQDTVPADRIVALQGGWSLFRNRYSGEVLVQLTYKAYVNDDEYDAEISDKLRDYPIGKEREAFMDVLVALIVSEEFQGIVTSETGNWEESEGPRNSTRLDLTDETSPLDPEKVSSNSNELIWLALIAGIVELIAINVGDSSLFNP
ncbi:tricalbin-3-like [Canna indica]|uniref:Tricalbin-3-like n=1 Tax=Canna indica TaxID=4628 RepID=A0AAQ3L0Q0_9LILI|nr:tricalbin-3-like [Canna indica]